MLLFTYIPAAGKPGKTFGGDGMTKTLNRLSIPVAFFCTAFLLQTVHAEQAMAPTFSMARFDSHLPVVDRDALIVEVETLRSQLIERKRALAQNVEDNTLDSGDALITALLPGGLLYAGFKKVRQQQAKEELARLNGEIKEFSDDLQAMQVMAAPAMVAQLP